MNPQTAQFDIPEGTYNTKRYPRAALLRHAMLEKYSDSQITMDNIQNTGNIRNMCCPSPCSWNTKLSAAGKDQGNPHRALILRGWAVMFW